MRHFLVLAAIGCAVLTTAATATAAPGYWWWSAPQANTFVKKMHPRTSDGKRLTLLTTNCRGKGGSSGGKFQVFACPLVFQQPNGTRTSDPARSFWFRTSKLRSVRVACWEWSSDGAELASRCPRAGNVTPAQP